MEKKYSLEEIIHRINVEILGTPHYGFEDESWQNFIRENFLRAGEINNQSYSSEVNQVLSSAAASQILNHIRLSLSKMKEEG